MAFDGEEDADDADTVCAINTLSKQLKPTDAATIAKETAKDKILSQVMRYIQQGWPVKGIGRDNSLYPYSKIADSLNIAHGCLLYGWRVVIPALLQPNVLDILHQSHLGMQRMKQLARTAVYWPNNEFRYNGTLPQMSRLWHAPARSTESTVAPMNTSGKTLESITRGSCDKFYGA